MTAELIADAESLSLRVVELTTHERAAYRAAFLADPFVRPELQRLHGRARRDRDAAIQQLAEIVAELDSYGLMLYALNLWDATIDRCKVAIDIAASELLKSKDANHAQFLVARPPEERPPAPGACPEVPGVRRADPPGPAGRARVVRPVPVPRGPAEEGRTR